MPGGNSSFGFADVGEVQLHFARAGEGDRLVLLLHGFPEFWYSWRHQLAALSDRYTVVAPDLRGYNLSSCPGSVSNYHIDRLVNDVAGLIRYFGRDDAAVIGHDWGAAIAWSLASRRPELIWKLGALQVPPAPVWKKNQTLKQFLASWYMFLFLLPAVPEMHLKRNDFSALADALCDSTASAGVFSEEDILQYKAAWSRPGALTAMLNYYRANVPARLFGKGGPRQTIDAPTLFIYGEKDKAILTDTVAGIGEFVSGPYTEHRIADAGHWVQQEAADEVSGVIGRFLDE